MKSLQEFFSLEGKAALVTGAAHGIGRSVAAALAGAGAGVACADLDREGAEAAAKQIVADGGRAVAITMDCGDEASIVEGVEATASQLGRLDILVNNAGIFPAAPIEQMEAQLFEQVHRVNLRGVFLCIREGAKPIKDSGGGAIINIASIDGLHPSFPGLGAYGSSKAGVIQLTRNAAIELAPYDIRVNVICPGPIRTEGTQLMFDAGVADLLLQRLPLKRVGDPGDVAGMVVALAGPAGNYVTGATLVIDGGYLLS